MADTPTRTLTAADLLALPGGKGERYELVEGALRVMTPAGGKHGQVVDAISGELYIHLKQNRAGVGVGAETGFLTRGDDRTVRAPDYAFIHAENVPEGGLPEGFLDIVPDLVVEVVSPHDRAADVDEKTQEWLAFGVRVVWIVYPNTARMFVYRQGEPSPQVVSAEETITGDPALPEFAVRVATFFGE